MSAYTLEAKTGDHRLSVEIKRDGPAMSLEEAREMLVRLAIYLTNPSELDRLALALSTPEEPAPVGRGAFRDRSIKLRRVK